MGAVRIVGVAAAALGCWGLLGCSSGPEVESAAATSSSGPTPASSAPSASEGAAVPVVVVVPEPNASPAPSASEGAQADAPPPGAPGSEVAEPPAVSPEAPPPAAVPASDGGSRPPAQALDARSPEQVVATAGDRGRRYLDGLRAAGLPPTGMDAAEILYADGTCTALASGTPRAEVLAEFDGVARAYAQFTLIPADRVAEIYVGTAERAYC